MADESRKKKSIRNIAAAFISNILIYILTFLTSKLIKENLGLKILGLNGVLGNVLSMLGLSEMGIGTAITFALYKPLAEDNQPLIRSLMRFYKRAYEVVALVVLVIGLALLPFLPKIVKSGDFSNSYVFTVYLLSLANSVVSYLLVYKRTIITADQKSYIITLISLVFSYITKIAQILVLVFTSNYILFLIVGIITSLLLNIIISIICDKMYPYLKGKAEKLPEETRKLIVTKVKALFLHSLGGVIVFGTDNILVSIFNGVEDVGRFSSYNQIIGVIGAFIALVFDNMKDSIGNYIVTESTEKQETLFKRLFFMNQTMTGICGVCLAILLTPFMKIWMGSDTVLPQYIVLTMVVSYYISRNRLAPANVKNAAGLFEPDKYASIIESLINLVASVLLAKKFGIMGIVLGTIISSVLCPFWLEPFIDYKYIFKKSVVHYFVPYFFYAVRTVAIYLACDFVLNRLICFVPQNFFSFMLEAAILFVVVCLLWLLTVFWKDETKYFFGLLTSKMRKNK